MAHLIRPNTPPQKWLLVSLLKPQPNVILKAQDFRRENDNGQELSANFSVVRSRIKDFCEKKDSLRDTSFLRAKRRYQAQLFYETLRMLLAFEKNLLDESFAIVTLAKEIAANITNHASTENIACDLPSIEHELATFIHWQVFLPANFVTEKSLPFMHSHNKKSGATLVISAFDERLSLECHEDDAMKFIAAIKHEFFST